MYLTSHATSHARVTHELRNESRCRVSLLLSLRKLKMGRLEMALSFYKKYILFIKGEGFQRCIFYACNDSMSETRQRNSLRNLCVTRA